VTDDHRDDQSRRHDRKQLLDGKDDQLTGFRLVFYAVNEFHVDLRKIKNVYIERTLVRRTTAQKKLTGNILSVRIIK